MDHCAAWLDVFLKPLGRLLSSRWWRERFRSQCSRDTPYDEYFKVFRSSVEHVDSRWGELANLSKEIWQLKEPLRECWNFEKMTFKSLSSSSESKRSDMFVKIDAKTLKLIDTGSVDKHGILV
jgi:hypothetical protein